MIENFGDTPFFAGRVPAETVAAMTACVAAVVDETGLSVGVNVLRNDALSALAIATVVDAAMIRVNVLSGTMFTDQGPVVGDAAEVVRLKTRLTPTTRIWADVMVKHALPPAGLTLEQAASDLWERGGADALVISGPGTGRSPKGSDFDDLRRLFDDAPLVVGSGANRDNLDELSKVADHVIVGTDLEVDAVPGNPIDPGRLAEFVRAATEVGLL